MRKVLLFAVLIIAGVQPSTGQVREADSASDDQSQTEPKHDQTTQNDSQVSTLEVKPGSPVIKQKDLWNETGYFHPFLRMPRYILQDQEAIWTSPFHTHKSDAKWWAIFAAGTAALVATDQWSVKQLPNSSTQVSVSTWASRFGAAYSLVPMSAGFYFIGTGVRDDRFRETGLIGFEALIDSNLTVEALKLVAARARPLEGNGKGRFEDTPNGRWDSGFPSGHAITTWAMASVVAHEYPRPIIIPILAYGLASTVVVARVGARQHFPGDVLAGSAMGWFIGDYIYGRRHNRELDHKSSAAQKILDHVRIGLAIQ
jgi:membrane-associated phospholipid phosphatase